MPTPPGPRRKHRLALVVLPLIIAAGAVGMVLITPVDREWTRLLREHQWRGFKNFMADSLFEGEMIGGGDPAMIYMIAVFTLYVLAWLPSEHPKLAKLRPWLERWRPWLRTWRPALGYLATFCLCSTVLLTHSLKWGIARARPKAVFRQQCEYSEWHQYGSHFIADGPYRGSFPSGHTATAFSLMGLAYALFNAPRSRRRTRLLGVLIGLTAIISGLVMGVARSMGGAHWLSDSLASIFIGWILAHLIYFWGLRVPEQDEYFHDHGETMPLPIFFEARICLLLLLACLGGTALLIGVRSALIWRWPWLSILIPLGAAAAVFFGFRAWRLGFFRGRLKDHVNQ